MKVAIIGGLMVIVLPLRNTIRKSKSGKTLVVASSRGNRKTSARVDKRPVIVNANAYIRPDSYVKEADSRQKQKSATHRRLNQPRKRVRKGANNRKKRT
jgi:hypothetical protein